MNDNAIVKGSIGAIAQEKGRSIAETFISADAIIIVDTSGSMGICDSRGNQKRYDVACYELAQLQKNLPGKIAVIAFSDEVVFCPNGKPWFFGSGTGMAKALQFVKVADQIPDMTFILISDGQPDNPNGTLRVASTFVNKIDTIFVGPENGSGRDFLQRLADASGGKSLQTATDVMQLDQAITGLLSEKTM